MECPGQCEIVPDVPVKAKPGHRNVVKHNTAVKILTDPKWGDARCKRSPTETSPAHHDALRQFGGL